MGFGVDAACEAGDDDDAGLGEAIGEGLGGGAAVGGGRAGADHPEAGVREGGGVPGDVEGEGRIVDALEQGGVGVVHGGEERHIVLGGSSHLAPPVDGAKRLGEVVRTIAADPLDGGQTGGSGREERRGGPQRRDAVFYGRGPDVLHHIECYKCLAFSHLCAIELAIRMAGAFQFSSLP